LVYGRRFLAEAVVKPGAAILFCLGFGLPMTLFGFQCLELEGRRGANGVVSFRLTRYWLGGMLSSSRDVSGVERVELAHTRTTSGGRRVGISQAVLVTGGGRVELFAGASNAQEDLKKRVVAEVDAFLKDFRRSEYLGQFRRRSVFGWAGLPFVVLGIIGLLRWPWVLYRKAHDDVNGGTGKRIPRGQGP